MPGLKNSASSRRSDVQSAVAVAAALTALGVACLLWCAQRGYTLYYGDAEAHLNIARRILDSRTPGGEQFGTVWLPLPHLLMMPFVASMTAWRAGWPGAIPSCACFVLAGTFLFLAARRCCGTDAGFTAAALFALNPNMLYLASTPMTEPVFAAALAGLLWATVWYRDKPSIKALLAAAAACIAASLTRYEGWFLIPFVALFLLFQKRKRDAAIFAVLAFLGPLAWLAHNQFYYSNALEFFNGPFSAAAIYARQRATGTALYPGDHDWRAAIYYFFAAMKLTIGSVALLAAALGALICLGRRYRWPLVLLALPPIFYVWSMHSGATPIYIPELWPHSWYNTRYALAALPFVAFTGGALVASLPRHWRFAAAALLVVASVAAIGLHRNGPPGAPANRQISACWKEADVNSVARRAWTAEAAEYLADHYRAGDGILFAFGDLSGVMRAAGIPFKEGLHDGNHPAWDAATSRPELFLYEEWVLAIPGDIVSRAMMRTQASGPHYRLRRQVIVRGAPVIEIYQRELPRQLSRERPALNSNVR